MKVKIVTSKRGSYFQPIGESPSPAAALVRSAKERQTIVGFGGAFTDAAAHVYATMDKEIKEKAIALYFGKDGLRYNIGRTTIGSCDFSHSDYDYAAKDDLSDFSLSHDEKEILPLIKDAEREAGFKLPLLSSTWSPLAKWKDNGDKCHGGRLKEECYGLHAAYLARYVKEMRSLGFDVASVSIQNEPEAIQTWESCIYTPEQEARLANILHSLLPETKLYIWDHNRDRLPERAIDTLAHCDSGAVYGIAYHWYDRNRFDLLEKTYEELKMPLLFSEGCIETVNQADFGGMGDYSSLTRYARNYLRDLNAGSTGFLDWNLFLDMSGGYNHVGNLCEAPIMSDGKSLRVNPSYYGIKHLSAYLEKGAKVYKAEFDDPSLSAALAINPNGTKVAIVLNEGERKTVGVDFAGDLAKVDLEPGQIATLIFE